MRHKKFQLNGIRLNGVAVEVQYGDLLVARKELASHLDWEVLMQTRDHLNLEQAAYDVHMERVDAEAVWGKGFLVRTDGHAHVLRGSGDDLDGFNDTEFDN